MDMYSTDVLNRVVADLKGSTRFLLDRYFPNVQTETSEEIHFDVDNRRRRISPFVAPMVAGRVVADAGYVTNTFRPAYIKDKRVFNATRPFKRAIGENLQGSMSPMDRQRALVANSLADQQEMLVLRQEVMASEALISGKLTISGEDYPTVVLDFGRNVAHSVTLGAGARWGETNVNPLNDLQDWSQIVLQRTGTQPIDIIMTVDVWKIFRQDPTVIQRLDVARAVGQLNQRAQIEEGGIFQGVVDGFNIFVYAGWYVDPATDLERSILPPGSVLMASPAIDGVRAYGAIRDEEAGFQAVPYYVKSWIEKDPAVRYILMQSAPLTVPYRINASLYAKVTA